VIKKIMAGNWERLSQVTTQICSLASDYELSVKEGRLDHKVVSSLDSLLNEDLSFIILASNVL
jgi:hypothetical protein